MVHLLSTQLAPTDVLEPLGNTVRIFVDEMKSKTAGGVILPEATKKKVTYYTGVVEAIGCDIKLLKVGDRVAWTLPPLIFTGTDDRIIVIDEESIVARIIDDKS